MKDWLEEIGHAERVAKLWCETADWTAHVSEAGRAAYLTLADQVRRLQESRCQIYDELISHKKVLLEVRAQLDNLLNPVSGSLIGVARQSAMLNQRVSVLEQDAKDRSEDCEAIDRKISEAQLQMAVAEKAIRQSIYAEIGRQADMHVQKSMEQWLNVCPVSDLCLSMAIKEHDLVEPVQRMLAKFIEDSSPRHRVNF